MKLSELLSKREDLLEEANRFYDFVQKPENEINIRQLKNRHTRFEKLRDEFDECHLEIINAEKNLDNLRNIKLVKIEFEELYYAALSIADEIIDKHQNSDKINTVVPNPDAEITVTQSIKLPDCGLPTFTGEYTDFSEFHDTFASLIDTNKHLSNSQKLQYLKSCLQNEVAKAIQSLKITDENYVVAWTTLKTRLNIKEL